MTLIWIIVLFSVTIAGLLTLIFYDRKKSRSTLREYQNAIASLRMQNIRNRMTSHFFFNVINGLSTQTEKPETIKDSIKNILMLLRKSIENIEQTAITLREELNLVNAYLELQKLKVPKPFYYIYDINNSTTMTHLIPAMIIQIPVENAIKHGLMQMEGEKILYIRINNCLGGLKIVVEDNGLGIKGSADRTIGTGTGLKVLYQTIYLLNSLNSTKIELSVRDLKDSNESETGTIVEIVIPTKYSFDILHSSLTNKSHVKPWFSFFQKKISDTYQTIKFA